LAPECKELAAYVTWLEARAWDIITFRDNWVQVKAVAGALMKERRLSYRRVRRIASEAVLV